MNVLFPYRTLFGDVTARVRAVRIDGEEPPGQVIDPDRQTVELRELERASWETAQIDIEVAGPATEIQDRQAQGEDPQASAVLNCRPTNARQTVRLQPSEADPSLWHGRTELDRAQWSGRIELRGRFTAEVGGVPHRIIGTASPWTIELDDLPRSPVHGSITVTWADFSAADVKPSALLHYADDPWFLLLDPDEPVLYLNKAFEGLEALLGDRRRRERPERVLHDQTRAGIASQAWAAMFNAALGSVEAPAGESAGWPSDSQWHESVLRILLPLMFPEREPEDALHELWELRNQPDGTAAVQQRLLPASSAHVGAPRLLRSGIALLGTEERQTGAAG